MSAESHGTRAIVAALFANIGIAITKFIAYLLTASSSMLAESIHSVADSGNQLAAAVGRQARQARGDAGAPLRLRPRPLHLRLHRLHRAVHRRWALRALRGVSQVFRSACDRRSGIGCRSSCSWSPSCWSPFSFRTAIVESNAVRGNADWVTFVRRARAPELPVILLEDLGALLGLVFALFGVGMTLITGDGEWDAAGTALIGVLLVTIAVILALETKSLLLGESATPENVKAIEAAIVDGPEVRAHHPHEDPPPWTGRASRGRENRGDSDRAGRRGRRGHRRRRGQDSCRRCPSPGPSIWSRTSTTRKDPHRRASPCTAYRAKSGDIPGDRGTSSPRSRGGPIPPPAPRPSCGSARIRTALRPWRVRARWIS